MKRFAELFDALDATTATSEKVALLRSYFAATPASDAAWAAYFLAGGKPRQTVRTAELRAWAQQAAGLPDWLFEECYQAVGDLAETIALVLPDALPIASADADRLPESGLATWIAERLLPLRTMDEAMRRQRVLAGWASLDARGRFLLTKLIGGGFRVGVSKLLVQRALAELAGVDAKVVAERMKKSRAVADVIMRRLGEGEPDRATRMNIELMHSVIFDMASRIGEDGGEGWGEAGEEDDDDGDEPDVIGLPDGADRVGECVALLLLARAGEASGQVAVGVTTTGAGNRPLLSDPLAGSPGWIVTAIPARDKLLDAMAFSRGRFLLDVSGLPSLALPSWPEVSRVIEDCR